MIMMTGNWKVKVRHYTVCLRMSSHPSGIEGDVRSAPWQADMWVLGLSDGSW